MHFEELTQWRKGAQRPEFRRSWRWLRRAPVTIAQVVLCLVIFASAALTGGSGRVAEVFAAGAASDEILFGDVWRLLTCGFVHGTWEHVLTTSVVVLLAGVILEPLIGAVAMLELSLWSSVAGAAACAVLGDEVGGAMLMLNGMLGALIAHPHIRRGRHVLSPRTWWPLLVIVLVQLKCVPKDYVSIQCHMASLLTGAVYGVAFRERGQVITARVLRSARQVVATIAARWRQCAPVTVSFVVLNLSIFGLTWWVGGEEALTTMSSRWGTGVEVFDGEWWRLVTGGVIHADWEHVYVNCVAILLTGAVVETTLGSLAALGLLGVSIVAGSIVGLGFDGGGVGASGAVFGLYGAAAAHPVKRGGHHVLSPYTWWPLVVLLYLWRAFEPVEFIGVSAHIAGLFVGALYGAALRPRGVPGPRWKLRSPRFALACLASLLVALSLAMDPRWTTNWHAASAQRAQYFGDGDAAARHNRYVEANVEYAERRAIAEAALFRFTTGDSMQARALLEREGMAVGLPEHVAMLGTLLWATEPADEQKASWEIRRALDKDPRSPVALNALARFWVDAKDTSWRAPRQAIGLARSAAMVDGYRTPEFMETLARAHLASGHDRQALWWMWRILRLELPDGARRRYERLEQSMERAAAEKRA